MRKTFFTMDGKVQDIAVSVTHCVICNEQNPDKPEMIELACCKNKYIHKSCLLYPDNSIRNKCPLCNNIIMMDTFYEDKDVETCEQTCNNIYNCCCKSTKSRLIWLQFINVICRAILFVIPIVYYINTYTNNKEGNLELILWLYVLGTILPCGIFWFFKLISHLCIKENNHIENKEDIGDMYKDYEGDMCCANAGIVMTPENENIFFKPIHGKCCTFSYETTPKNWIKVYFYQMFIYVYAYSISSVLIAILVYYTPITSEQNIILLVVNWLVFTLPCTTGVYWCDKNKYSYSEKTTFEIATRQGVKQIEIV